MKDSAQVDLIKYTLFLKEYQYKDNFEIPYHYFLEKPLSFYENLNEMKGGENG